MQCEAMDQGSNSQTVTGYTLSLAVSILYAAFVLQQLLYGFYKGTDGLKQ